MNPDHSECSTLSRNLNTINENGLSQNFLMPAGVTENLSSRIDPLIHNGFFRSSDSVVTKLTSTVHSRTYLDFTFRRNMNGREVTTKSSNPKTRLGRSSGDIRQKYIYSVFQRC